MLLLGKSFSQSIGRHYARFQVFHFEGTLYVLLTQLHVLDINMPKLGSDLLILPNNQPNCLLIIALDRLGISKIKFKLSKEALKSYRFLAYMLKSKQFGFCS